MNEMWPILIGFVFGTGFGAAMMFMLLNFYLQ